MRNDGGHAAHESGHAYTSPYAKSAATPAIANEINIATRSVRVCRTEMQVC